ncbi:MAG: hypothetical protein HQ513_06585 [Rhodospirillales bacterium]|nr:hypothetical protein [Rhodospirillales bacterium]
MQTFVLGFVVVILAILGMAIGVLFGRRPLKEGGCGNIDGTGVCGVCGGDIGDALPRNKNGGSLS